TWSRRGLPTEPSAWFTRVATDGLRSERVASEYGHDLSLLESRSVRLDDGVEDWLSLLFACADERLVPRVRLVLCRKRLAELTTLETDERGATRLQTVQQALYLQF